MQKSIKIKYQRQGIDMNLLMGYNIKNNGFLLRKSKKKENPNDTGINTIGSNLTIYTIFDSKEL